MSTSSVTRERSNKKTVGGVAAAVPAGGGGEAPKKPIYRGCASGEVGAYVRRCNGECWQARLWVGERNGGHINLGLYETAEAARQVAKKVLKSLPLGVPWDALEVWRTAKRLARNGWDVEDQLSKLLPKYVVEVSALEYAFRILGGVSRPVDQAGFSSPEDAHRAALVEVAKRPAPLSAWERQRRKRRAERKARYARCGIVWREQLTMLELIEG